MDTPQRKQIGTPMSKFEDSPVFNYINNLSPIKPVDSHITQTFHSLSFASISSVFASPHISTIEKSRFLRRCYFLEASKAVFSSDDGDEGKIYTAFPNAVHLSEYSANTEKKCKIEFSNGMVPVATSDNDRSQQDVQDSQALEFGCDEANDTITPDHTIKTGHETELVDTSCLLMKYVEEGSEKKSSSTEGEAKLHEVCQLDRVKDEATDSDWENLISDAEDLLITDGSVAPDAPEIPDQKLLDNNTSLTANLLEQNTNVSQAAATTENHNSPDLNLLQDCATREGEAVEPNEVLQNSCPVPCLPKNDDGVLKEKMIEQNEESDPLDGKLKQPGMRRRCLVFEVAGVNSKNLQSELRSCSSLSQSNVSSGLQDRHMISLRTGGVSSSCMIPGIGLHLNTLAVTSKKCRAVKQEILASGRRMISVPGCVGSFRSLSIQQKSCEVPSLHSSERDDTGASGKGIPSNWDTFEASLGAVEDPNPSSPKKKRRKLESPAEPESCKHCNCKRSKCLKLYCECFAAGVYCIEPCSCHDCYNKPVHEDMVLATRKQIESRNPLAFAPKVIRSTESASNIGNCDKTPASARHKRGCNCKKSTCNKKYCECYQGEVGCSSNCRCEGCKNAYGRKDEASITVHLEEFAPEEEIEASEKSGPDQSLQLIEDEGGLHSTEPHWGMSPFSSCREPTELSSFSSAKPPRPFLPTGSVNKSEAANSHQKLEKDFQFTSKCGTSRVLIENSSPVVGVKTVSPNRKRISPPSSGLSFGLSPGRKSSRKLILQSIPPLPSLLPVSEATNN